MSNAKMNNGNAAWTKPRPYRGSPWIEATAVLVIVAVASAVWAIWA